MKAAFALLVALGLLSCVLNTSGLVGESTDGGAAVGTFCAGAGAHDFCADFDRDPNVFLGWTSFRDQGAAYASYGPDESTWKSPPRSLATHMAAGARDCAYAELRRTFTGASTSLTLAFDFFPGAPPGGSGLPAVGAAAIEFASGCGVVLVPAGGGGSVFLEYDPSGQGGEDHGFQASPVPGKWTRVTMHLDIAGAAPALAVTFDGVQVAQLRGSRSCPASAGSVDVALGAHCNRTMQAAEMRYDNVTVDLR